MIDYKPISQPFANAGVVQREDPSQLGAGEYYQLENMYSEQEGALTARTGHQQLLPVALSGLIYSIGKLNLGGADAVNPRYLGCGTQIFRTDADFNLTNLTLGLGSGGGIGAGRWSSVQYNAGAAGTPTVYFATPGGPLKDSGAYPNLQNWGCDPPLQPAAAKPDSISFTSLGLPAGSTSRFLAGVNSNGSAQKTVSAMDAGTGYISITPTAGGTIQGTNGIYPGMLITINDSVAGNETVIVTFVGNGTFNTYVTIAHAAANVLLTASQTPITSVNGTTKTFISGLNLDASYQGIAQDGYDSDDIVHLGLFISDATVVTDFRIQLVPNFTGAPYTTDYYEKSILPSSITAYVGTTTEKPTTAVVAVQDRAQRLDYGLYNNSEYPSSDYVTNYIQPYEAAPSVANATSEVWTELSIPKNQFAKIGNAGTGLYTWKNINQAYIYIVAGDTTAVVKVSSIYISGGGGLNSSAAGTTLYDYLYTYRNPSTGYESNPSVAMIPSNLPPPIEKRAMRITVAGTDTASSAGNADFSGPGSIVIYRAGGSFADSIYRRVGYATNPGAGATVDYIDNATDLSLDTADSLEFDNDPPVRSPLKTPLVANIDYFKAPDGSGSNLSVSPKNSLVRVYLTNLPTNYTTIAQTITVGTQITIGTGVTSERVQIAGIPADGSPFFVCYLQYAHAITANDNSETVEADSINRGKCTLIAQDFDCVFLAGDKNNPQTLYQSKRGRPEAFPVAVNASGNVNQINVGAPSNPINGIVSFNAELVCMNLNNLFIVQVWNGQMQQPQKSQSSRGLYSPFCWCQGDDRLWFLSYDGIYTWAGGQSEKITDKIDYLFRNKTKNGILPMDLTKANLFSFSFARNQLFVVYVDIAGNYRRMRFDTIMKRWHFESIQDTAGHYFPIGATFTEEDSGKYLIAPLDPIRNLSNLWLCDFSSTTDGWTVAPTDGLPINYSLQRYWPTGEVGADEQIGEILCEISNQYDPVTLSLFYNYATAETESLPIPPNPAQARYRYVSTVNSGTPQTAYSVGLRLSGKSGTNPTPVVFYTFSWRAFQLEEVTTGATTDWTDLGHPYDKYLYDVAIQYDTGGKTIDVYLDTIGGVQGNVQNLAVASYEFSGAGRSLQTFLMPDQLIAKMIRFRPKYNSDLRQFKWWKYQFRKEDYPPDNMMATAWDNSNYPCDKIYKVLTLQVDTGGLPATVNFEVDGVVAFTFRVTTTFNDRARTISLPSNIIGKEYRLVPGPSIGGKFQLFAKQVQYETEPCAITHFDSYEQVLGFAGWKYIKQIWIEYQCPVGIVFSIYRDGGALFYQKILPAHPVWRETERFYLPDYIIPAAGTAPQFNKSKAYRFVVDAIDLVSGFKFYRDGSRIETRQLDGDQRAGYQQHVLWEQMPLAS